MLRAPRAGVAPRQGRAIEGKLVRLRNLTDNAGPPKLPAVSRANRRELVAARDAVGPDAARHATLWPVFQKRPAPWAPIHLLGLQCLEQLEDQVDVNTISTALL